MNKLTCLLQQLLFQMVMHWTMLIVLHVIYEVGRVEGYVDSDSTTKARLWDGQVQLETDMNENSPIT
jgi:hypothetical protein